MSADPYGDWVGEQGLILREPRDQGKR